MEPNQEFFRFDFRVRSGKRLATFLGPFQTVLEIHEYGTWLRVRSDEKLAMLVLTRHNGNLVERPIGLFRMRLDDRGLMELRNAVESTAWSELPSPEGGEVMASQLEIDYKRGSLLIQREFNARNRGFIEAIWPLMDGLNVLMGSLLARPAGALTVSVSTAPDSAKRQGRHLKLILENPGRWPIALTDPRVVEDTVPKRARLLVAPAPRETPGMTALPPRLSTVELPRLAEGIDPLHVLPGGGKLELSVMWQAPGPGAYIVQGVWSDYHGPIREELDHLPMMPLPGDDEPPSRGAVYPVRGSAFSAYASFLV